MARRVGPDGEMKLRKAFQVFQLIQAVDVPPYCPGVVFNFKVEPHLRRASANRWSWFASKRSGGVVGGGFAEPLVDAAGVFGLVRFGWHGAYSVGGWLRDVLTQLLIRHFSGEGKSSEVVEFRGRGLPGLKGLGVSLPVLRWAIA
jgi:hypothetical protein